jgi:putative ABC transport system permease protein
VTMLGGLLGIGLGIRSADLVSTYAKWKTIVSVNAVVLSFAVSVAVGLMFGMYPAFKAAQTDPITALRHE